MIIHVLSFLRDTVKRTTYNVSVQRWINTESTLCNLTARILLMRVGGPRVVVSTAAFHARVRGSVPGLGG